MRFFGKVVSIIVALIWLVFLPAFPANLSIEAEISVYPNDTAILRSYYASPVSSSIFGEKLETEEGSRYLARLVKDGQAFSETNFSPSFLILTDPPEETPEAVVLLILPIESRAIPDGLEVFSPSGKRLVSERLYLCDNDGSCLGRENSLSCPSDCFPGGSDGFCEADSAGCDPDCEKGFDAGCIEKTKGQKEDGDNPVAQLFAVVAVLASIFLAMRFFSQKRKDEK